MRRTLVVALALLTATGLALPTAQAAPSASSASSATRIQDDFNGDGYADLAVAAPSATVNGRAQAGYVAVQYGSRTGWIGGSRKLLTQNSTGVPGTAEKGDRFGSALTTADLDRDGYTDLVVGVGGEDTSFGTDSGYVEVVWGGARGLSGAASLAAGKSAYDRLGNQGRLTAADIHGDGATDLVTVQNDHDLRVLKGPFGRNGSAKGEQLVPDKYSSAVLDLAAGDINGDGITDVVAAENDQEEFDSRRVVYWYGTRNGLTPYTLVYDIDGAGLQGGENLDVGDVNRDGYDDIVVGRTIDGYDSDLDTYLAKGGRVAWIPGTAQGPDGVKAQFLNQSSPGVPGEPEKGDRFGTDIHLADVDGDGYPDVVTGVPGEDLGTPTDRDAWPDAGAVVVLKGRAGGLTGAGPYHQVYTQNDNGVPGAAEKGDAFGAALFTGDANRDGLSDVSVGAPGENANAGYVWAFRSRAEYVVVPGGLPIPSTLVGEKGTTSWGSSAFGVNGTAARLGSNFAG
ncbi:FG-GAP-like repeat-containing protein [Streptomyces sp. YU58]|uniref:FG-GAP-like repeat-containing protein n=1 Tax=Streptomyces sp. SX92 TaxID=3158972 RepID=UPI0027BA8049|nr:FG-GAP-like repeat-containing protein [Streptomyces coralus]WLW55029.1 FG-GAP-like repeat-containing protein [Streptomyces coralus]